MWQARQVHFGSLPTVAVRASRDSRSVHEEVRVATRIAAQMRIRVPASHDQAAAVNIDADVPVASRVTVRPDPQLGWRDGGYLPGATSRGSDGDCQHVRTGG